MVEFMKEIKKKSDLTDEEAAQIAASKIADSKPKSRMYYKIGASRAMAGSKKSEKQLKEQQLAPSCAATHHSHWTVQIFFGRIFLHFALFLVLN